MEGQGIGLASASASGLSDGGEVVRAHQPWPALEGTSRHRAGPSARRTSSALVRAALRRRGGPRFTAAVLVGVLGSAGLVWQGTTAAFTSTTPTGSNAWTTGAVTVSDDDSGSALFTVTGLVPGSTGSNCITVTYSGNVATTVKLYASASSDSSSVAQYLDLTIQEGSGGGFGSCGSFSASSTIYTGTLATFTSTKTAYGSGVGTWAPSSSATRVYKITYTLNASTPSAKQSTSTTATFQWEAQA
jgi:hypothetical protein